MVGSGDVVDRAGPDGERPRGGRPRHDRHVRPAERRRHCLHQRVRAVDVSHRHLDAVDGRHAERAARRRAADRDVRRAGRGRRHGRDRHRGPAARHGRRPRAVRHRPDRIRPHHDARRGEVADVRAAGRPKSHAGQSSLSLAAGVNGWRAGDRLGPARHEPVVVDPGLVPGAVGNADRGVGLRRVGRPDRRPRVRAPGRPQRGRRAASSCRTSATSAAT